MDQKAPINMRSRLSRGPSPAMRRYVSQDRMESELKGLANLTDVNLAHVVMLRQRDILGAPVARQLLARLLDIAERGVAALGALDVADDEGLYLAYEARLIADLGLQVGGSIHTGRSRNDLGATTHRMATREALLQMLEAVLAFRAALLARAGREIDTVMNGYTHFQAAQPITLGHWLLAFENAAARDTRRLLHAYEHTNLLPLGAGALAGTDFPVDPAMTAGLLGFTDVLGNSLDAVGTRDYALEAASAMAIMATTLSRFALDLQIWATGEFNYIVLPDSLAGVSSIMPQKKNPVVLEWLKGRAAHVLANLDAMLGAQKNTSYSNVIDVNRESVRSFPTACEDMLGMLTLATETVEGITPNRQRMLQRAAESYSTVTLLANYLVREHGLSFRAAYQVVSAVVKAALAQGLDSTQVTAALVTEVAQQTAGLKLEVPEAALKEALDPRVNVARLRYGGGPSPEHNREQLAQRALLIESDRGQVQDLRAGLAAARARLLAAARELAAG